MRNDELFSPGCPDDRAKRLVINYALRDLLDDRRCYEPGELLCMQYKIYLEWLAALRTSRNYFSCDFYEWMARDEDSAFIFRQGDLVKHDGRYCVVIDRVPGDISWGSRWRIIKGGQANADWPQRLNTVKLRDSGGHTFVVNALAASIEPADIPPEVFALACGRAKDCPMLKGGSNG